MIFDVFKLEVFHNFFVLIKFLTNTFWRASHPDTFVWTMSRWSCPSFHSMSFDTWILDCRWGSPIDYAKYRLFRIPAHSRIWKMKIFNQLLSITNDVSVKSIKLFWIYKHEWYYWKGQDIKCIKNWCIRSFVKSFYLSNYLIYLIEIESTIHFSDWYQKASKRVRKWVGTSNCNCNIIERKWFLEISS